VDEIARLRQEHSSLTGAGLEEGIVQLPVARVSRRLDTLSHVLDGARDADPTCVAIGRRATLRDESGEVMCYWIVLPGDGDPDQGWISADSPLGSAVLGATAGAVVHVEAPAGRWSVAVVAVDDT
jgi:transcription elongation factor GreA